MKTRLVTFSALTILLIAVETNAMSWLTERVPIVEYGTEQFNDWLSDKTVTPQQAWEIHRKHLDNTTGLARNYYFWICVGNEYLFSNSFYNKQRHVSLTGLYVNAYSGAVRFHRSKEIYKLQQAYDTATYRH